MKHNSIKFIYQYIALFFLILRPYCGICKIPTKEISLEERAARMIIVGMPGVELTPRSTIINDITKRKIGGVILFESNVVSAAEKKLSPEQLAKINFKERLTKLCTDIRELADYPIIISIDQEGGLVNRLKERYGFVPSVTQQYLGEQDDEFTTRRYARSTAEQLYELGINTNFAPCVDVNINPECPVIGRNGRSFSQDTTKVVKHASYVIEEHHKKGVITAIKHFPGHGSSLKDTHLGISDVTETWQDSELMPYKKLLVNAKEVNSMVMVSHVFNGQIDKKYPATLSYKTVTELLRKKIGWNGVVVTDDMHMKAITDHYTDVEAVTLTINAGVDMLIYSSSLNSKKNEYVTETIIDIIVSQVKKGLISENRISESYDRISRLLL